MMMIVVMMNTIMTRKNKVSMSGEIGSKENKTVENYDSDKADLESSIFLALSKWKLLNSQSV